MAQFDYQVATDLLRSLYQQVSDNVDDGVQKALDDNAVNFDLVINSKTQSYREVLLGCALIYRMDSSLNLRTPYAKQGENAFSGRTFDENVINPFLQENLFPCGKSPYLNVFRRGTKFVPETADGLRDKIGYSSLLELLSIVESIKTAEEVETFIKALLYKLIVLRNASRIPLARISRFSIEQYRMLLTELVRYKSGGLLPVLITVAFFQTMAERYSLAWDITWQGINVADSATGAEGDVTIKENGITLLAIEITERPLDHRRIESTFNTKIILNDVKEYLFIYTNTEPDESARRTAKTLFSRGYEINFASIVELIVNNFLALPANARETFTNKMLSLLDSRDVSAAIKVKWNESVKSVLQI